MTTKKHPLTNGCRVELDVYPDGVTRYVLYFLDWLIYTERMGTERLALRYAEQKAREKKREFEAIMAVQA